MEDTLGGDVRASLRFPITCLNPCFNGRYSRSAKSLLTRATKVVLILVLMEDTLGDCYHVMKHSYQLRVLILVLMEDTLGAYGSSTY